VCSSDLGFKSAIVYAWIARATQELEANHLNTARAALDSATEIAPDETTEALREAWLRYVEKLTLVRGMGMNAGDLEEGLRAANEIGDDTLQREAGRRVQPDSFTHGTSEQRMRWFRTGFDSGSLAACDTFSAATL
jgi:acyl transferase domain-containing protein